MRRGTSNGRAPIGRSRRGYALLLAVAGLLLLSPALRAEPQTDAVDRAFERARSAGSYHFTSDVEAVTAPLASALSAGTSSQTDHLTLEGMADLDGGETEFSMWTGASGTNTTDSSVGFRTADGTTQQRVGNGPWEASTSGAPGFAPQGDQLSFLLGATEVVDLGPVPGQDATRYGFDLDGAEFAAALAAEMAEAAGTPGGLPLVAEVAIPAQYRDMTGTGELWVDRSSGLPIRHQLTVRFPPQGDSVVTADITTDFTRFGYADGGPTTLVDRLALQPLAAGGRLAANLAPFALLAAAVLVTWRRHPEVVRTSLVVVIAVGVLVAGPLASTSSAMTDSVATGPSNSTGGTVRDEEVAALTRQAQMANVTAVDPHLDRRALAAASLQFQVEDSDGDGLLDAEEDQIGTDPLSDDTDGDGHSDLVELEGFTLPGTGAPVWYPDPNLADSNEDGIPDSIEWDITGSGSPGDTDGDGTPDLFDTDNDGDGVPDHRDVSPFTRGTEIFDEQNPLSLTLDGLTPGGIPTFVQFQLRPQDESQLRFALRPLDWPRDLTGQIRDVNDSPDDLTLVPMLEVAFPTDAPVVPDASTLEPYSIRLDDPTSPSTAYVPLSMVTDERNGQKVAFGGQMRYQSPASGQSWGGAHQVRLAWMVRVDNDIACSPGDSDPLPGDPAVPLDSVCGEDGYRYERAQTVHSYFGDWTLTGLEVTEEHGAQTALIHEDPSVDDDDRENGPTWALADVLSERLLTPVAGPGGEPVYALEIDDLEARFGTGSASPDSARYGLGDVFSVDQRDHGTFDDAMRAVTEDIYDEVLPRYGDAGSWNPTSSPMPLVMTAYATDTRTLTLDDALAGGDRVQWGGHALHVDLVPAIDRTRSAGLTWSSYCGGGASAPVWSPCDIEQVGDRLEARYADVNIDPADPTRLHDESVDGPLDPDVVRGQDIVMMSYYLAVANGISTVLSHTDAAGVTTTADPYVPDTDEELRSRVAGGARVAKTVAQMLHFKYLEGATNMLRKSLSLGTIASQEMYKQIGNQGTLSTLKRLVPKGLLVGAVVVTVVAVGVAVGYALAGNPDAQIALGVAAQVAGTVASLSVFVPFANQVSGASAAGALALLKDSSKLIGITKAATFIGTVIVLGVVWGFFISDMAGNGIVAGSPAFNAALSTVLATSIFIVLLAVLSLTIAGALLVGVVAAIDGILTLICEYGSEDDREVLTVDGQCFTIGGSIIQVLSDFLYTYDPLVDLGRDDLVSVEVPDDEPLFQLADATNGYAVGNALDVTLDVTTDIRHLYPDALNVPPHHLSAQNLIDSTFEYSVTSPSPAALSADLGEMRADWGTLATVGSYRFTPLLRTTNTHRVTAPDAIALADAGLGVPFQYHLNMAYATPALECWVPYLLPFICDVEALRGDTSIAFDPVYFDVFPETIDAFLATTPTAGGHRFAWDRGFDAIEDFDGDGLRSAASGGLDPDDERWDTDGDGLGDAFELSQRENGWAFSLTSPDTDGDGLDDGDEFRLGTDPAVIDTDRDGLSDQEEVDGWEITLESTGRTIRATSDPLLADTDIDGIGDEAERFLADAGQTDEDGRAFHPRAANVPPLSVSIGSDAPDGFVRPGDQVEVETTVDATTPLGPSVLDLDVPFDDPLPVELGFDPEGADDQTISRTDTLTIPGGQSGDAVIAADVRGRLVEPAEPPAMTLDPRTSMASSHPRGWLDVTPMLVDTVNSFAVVDEAHDRDRFGSVWPRVPGAAINPTMELDRDTDTTVNPPRDDWAQRKSGGVTTACTDDADCMTVWPWEQNCMEVTVHWVRANAISDQNNDLEIGVYLNRTSAAFDLPRFEQLWHSVADGFGSIQQGQMPLVGASTDLCGFGYLAVVETDGEDRADLVGCDDRPPANTNCKPLHHRSDSGQLGLLELTLLGGTPKTGRHTARFEFADCPDSNCDEVLVNYTLKAGAGGANGQVDRLAGAVTDGVSDITRPQFSIGAVGPDVHDLAPAIATDGDRFLLVWTRTTDRVDGRVNVEFLAREYDDTGAPTGPAERLESAFVQAASARVPTLDVAWARGRSPVIVADRDLPAGATWTTVKPLPSTMDVADAVDLAIDSRSGVATAVHQTPDGIYATWFQSESAGVSAALGSRRVIMLGAGNSNALESPVVARAPGVGGWLIGARYVGPDNADVVVGRYSEDYFLATPTPRPNPTAPATQGELLKLDNDFTVRHSLACASGDSAPVVDLRFEEIPGATQFEDSSPLGNHGTNPSGTLPAAGLAASPSPDSDFAASLRIPQRVELPNTAVDATTFSVWVRSDPGTNPLTRFLWVRVPQAGGYDLDVRSGSVAWRAGGTGRTETGNGVDRPRPLDGEWHHVVVTSADGTGAIYVDGTPWAQGFAMGDPALGPVAISGDGVIIDDFKMYDRALSPHEIDGLRAQTAVDRCVLVAAEGTATPNAGRYPWAEITLTPHDPVALLLASAQLGLQVDDANPIPTIVRPSGPVPGGTPTAPGTYVLSGSVSDVGSGVTRVEVSVDGGPWVAAEGLDTWSYAMSVVDGTSRVRVRAFDAVGNIGATFTDVVVDGVAPEVTLDATPGTPVAPGTDSITGAPTVRLTGSAADAGAGIDAPGVEVQLVPSPSDAIETEEDWQQADLVGDRWTIDYRFSATASDVSGAWDVRVRATDGVGNVSDHAAVDDVVRLDASAPEVAVGDRDADRSVIAGSDVLELAGEITDPGGAGIAALELAFTPLDTLLALPDGATVDDLPDAPTWLPIDLVESGPGVTETSWSFAIDGELEDSYQVDLRATDAIGNRAVRPNVWRGVIDTTAPRLALTADPTGNLHTGGTRFEVAFDCSAVDLFLDPASFDCDEGSGAPAVRSLVDDPALQAQFPDLPQLERMDTAFTRWERGPESDVEFTACDLFGNCTAIDDVVDDDGLVTPDLNVAVVDPTDGQHISVDGPVDLAIVAEAAASIRSLVITVDGDEVARHDFADGEVTTFDARIPVDVTGGTHTVMATVQDWAGGTRQSSPATFFADTQDPPVTVTSTEITVADSWGPGTGTIRFHGDVADDGTIASVEVKVGDGEWTDVIVDGDGWRGALPVPDADGEDLVVRVRATDLAGRSTVVSETASVDLSPDSPDFVRPDTVIRSGPPETTTSDSATFGIDLIAGSNEAVSLLCSLDGSLPAPCPRSWTVDDLSSGDHHVAVVAVDSAGHQDLSPATAEWSVTPSGPQVEILDAPAETVSVRSASFAFSSESGASFECRLDGSVFEACTSPTTYEELSDGPHRFEVRATVSEDSGTATAYTWTIANAAPVAQSQEVIYGDDPDGTPIALDAVDDDPLTFRIVDGPENGLLEGAGADRTYRPVTGFGGADRFTFQAFDGDEWSNVATVTLDSRTPVVTWPQPDSIVYGTVLGDEQLDATASISGTFTYEPDAGTLLVVGTHTLSATFTPDDDRYETADATVTVEVTPRPLRIEASSGSHFHGTPPPSIEPIFDGFADGEGVDDLEVAPTCVSTSTEDSGTGWYVSTCTGASDPDYAISYADGLIRVTRAPTTLILDQLSKVDSLRTKSIEFSAWLYADAAREWLEGEEVRFQFADGTPTCTATTDADGHATCEVALTKEMRRLLLRERDVEAFFDGTADYHPSSDSATTLNSGSVDSTQPDEPVHTARVTALGLGAPDRPDGADSLAREFATTGVATLHTTALGLWLLASGLLLSLLASRVRIRRERR